MSFFSNFFIRHYKRYNSFWCWISSLAIGGLVLTIIVHHKLDPIGTFLLGFLIPLGAGTYKAHDDKDKKNEPIFKGRRECFHDLRNMVWKLYSLPRDNENSTKSKYILEKELIDIHIKVEQYFSYKSRIFTFIDQVRNAAIHYLYGVNELSSIGLRNDGYVAAEEFLRSFLKQKEFLNRRREFELDIFKPETFDPIWEKSFDDLLKERRAMAKAVP